MKTKILLITISCIALLLTSCERDEMGNGGTGGGGKDQEVNAFTNSLDTLASSLNEKEITPCQ